MQDLAELFSLGLTMPTVILGALVVVIFSANVWNMFKTKGQLDSTEWLILGVWVGFVGQCLDNTYWAIPWTSSFLRMPVTDYLVNIGVFFNIPFRQVAGILAAYCHLRSTFTFFDSTSQENGLFKINTIAAVAFVCGLVYAMLLIWVR